MKEGVKGGKDTLRVPRCVRGRSRVRKTQFRIGKASADIRLLGQAYASQARLAHKFPTVFYLVYGTGLAFFSSSDRHKSDLVCLPRLR
jgi:hypothetical protein